MFGGAEHRNSTHSRKEKPMIWRRKKEEPRAWVVRGGEVKKLTEAVLTSEHTLIAGTTGCGKSTLVNGLLCDLLKYKAPSEARLVLLDPKRLELGHLKDLPHTIRYEDTPSGAVAALAWVASEMNRRYEVTQRTGARAWSGSHIYVVIDELMPLVLGKDRGEFNRLMSLLLTQGRASGIHIIAATQCPNRDCLNKNIKPLFDMRIGMRCSEAIESREVIGIKGCENLPRHGEVLVKWRGELQTVRVPMTDYTELDDLISYWTSGRCVA